MNNEAFDPTPELQIADTFLIVYIFILISTFNIYTFKNKLEQSASSIDNEGKVKDLLSRILHNVVHTVVFEVWVGEVEDGHGGVWPHLIL